MTTAEMDRNVRMIRQHFEDFVDRKDVSAVDRNFAEDFVDHDPPGGTKTVAEGKQLAVAVFETFPDMRCLIEDVVAQGDKVMVRSIWSGHDARTGQLMEFHGFTLWRFRDGKIVERWATTTGMKTVAGDRVVW